MVQAITGRWSVRGHRPGIRCATRELTTIVTPVLSETSTLNSSDEAVTSAIQTLSTPRLAPFMLTESTSSTLGEAPGRVGPARTNGSGVMERDGVLGGAGIMAGTSTDEGGCGSSSGLRWLPEESSARPVSSSSSAALIRVPVGAMRRERRSMPAASAFNALRTATTACCASNVWLASVRALLSS